MEKQNFHIPNWLIVFMGFLLIIFFSWINELLDLPHVFFGAPATKVNLLEALFESWIIGIVGSFVLLVMLMNTREKNVAVKMLQESAEQISKLNEDLKKMNTLKNEFLGIAAHDLRNPLIAIKQCSSLLLEKDQLNNPKETKMLISTINRSSLFMNNLITDLLDIAKIESGKLNINLAENNYLETIQYALKLNSVFAKQHGVTINLKTEGKIPRFFFDENKIIQVLNNLLSNAIKYSTKGSSITLEIHKLKHTILTKVSDQGIGIQKDDLDQIFNPFFKTTDPSREKQTLPSTGLGLAISMKIVEGHHGSIVVESIEGKGATFSFTLPCERSEA